jgi:hypothetical protein
MVLVFVTVFMPVPMRPILVSGSPEAAESAASSTAASLEP